MFFFLIILVLITRNILENISLNKENRYTIGEITKIEPNVKSGYQIYFDYYVLGKKYEAFGGIYQKNDNLIGGRFYIRFSPSNPRNCKLLLDEPVQGNIKEAPPEGWGMIPE